MLYVIKYTLKFSRLLCQDKLEMLEARISDEELCTMWMIEHITMDSSVTLERKDHPELCSAHLPILPSTGTLECLFWSYFQLACVLWNQILTDGRNLNALLAKKLGHTVRLATLIFEQSPQDIQDCIIRKICMSSDILLLCGRLAVALIKGMLVHI